MDPFKSFAAKRIFLGILLLVVVLWVIGTILGSFQAPSAPSAKHTGTQTAEVADTHGESAGTAARHETGDHRTVSKAVTQSKPTAAKETAGAHEAAHTSAHEEKMTAVAEKPAHGTAPAAHAPKTSHDTAKPPAAAPKKAAKSAHGTTAESGHGAPAKSLGHGETATLAPHTWGVPEAEHQEPPGVLFVDAVIAPLDYELNDRFWGWRPNDVLDFTDNVNSFQLGVLEVTRRAVTTLTDRISRTGSTAAFDPDLENATNWLMIKAESYWFPSPESKYNEALEDLQAYREKLKKGRASFYTRTDNLIPLLAAFEDLLGSCDENLAKFEEKGGGPVSFFDADNYFYYAKGVASAMGTILQAIHEEFLKTLEARRATEILHHAIQSCHHATEIDPWIVTNSDLSGILANHRANMAAPISHARFYLGVLIKTLST